MLAAPPDRDIAVAADRATLYRASDVYVLSAPLLSKQMEARLEPYVPETITDEHGQQWVRCL